MSKIIFTKKQIFFKNKILKAENIFHLKYDIKRITKLIYKYEIYKRVLKAAGEIFKLGYSNLRI